MTLEPAQQEVRSYRYKLERVSKGYVRVTVHSDNTNELITDWNTIHQQLENLGERIEHE